MNEYDAGRGVDVPTTNLADSAYIFGRLEPGTTSLDFVLDTGGLICELGRHLVRCTFGFSVCLRDVDQGKTTMNIEFFDDERDAVVQM